MSYLAPLVAYFLAPLVANFLASLVAFPIRFLDINKKSEKLSITKVKSHGFNLTSHSHFIQFLLPFDLHILIF